MKCQTETKLFIYNNENLCISLSSVVKKIDRVELAPTTSRSQDDCCKTFYRTHVGSILNFVKCNWIKRARPQIIVYTLFVLIEHTANKRL